ncbi:DinB family protein [Nocardioides sp. YIM 152315]|uniref:DinB family protein n=1 Tax=Nocardioides sp. YIM 152315 TaxID=3031760 RepID=UPI0023DA9308|nr:DinB family protein [Nocardioides sp. YIM 152315]MDF1603336.1 DinB family protein [Nocardioides sp. YIM 152315]
MTDPTTRVDPPTRGDERTLLLAFLDYHRRTLRMKAGGLDATQLATALPPSEMTLGGMVKHLGLVEDNWLREVFLGEEPSEPWRSIDWGADYDWDWHSARDDSPEQIWALYDEMVSGADAIIADAALDDLSAKSSRGTGEPFSLRWILLHLIEEYARHNGHADLIRESIDGETGE